LLLAAAGALVIGVVLAVVSGAEQTSTAMDRLRAQTNASDVVFGVDGDPGALLNVLAAAPGVLETEVVRVLFVRPSGADDLFPSYNLLTVAPITSPADVSTDVHSIDVPFIVEGRAADEHRADEVTMSDALVAALELQVGDELVLESMSSAWVDSAYSGQIPGPPDGPKVTVELVGVTRTLADFDRYVGVLNLYHRFS